MSILYLFTRSPAMFKDLELIVKIALNQSNKGINVGLVFIQDAVIGLVKGSSIAEILENKNSNLNIYALGSDLKARGIKPNKIISNAKIVNYNDLVDLIMDKYQKIVST